MSIDFAEDAKNKSYIQALAEFGKPKAVSLRAINSSLVGKDIVIEGKVSAISHPEIIPMGRVYVCLNCPPDKDNKFVTYEFKPKKCQSCAEADFEEQDTDLEDVQVFKLIESKIRGNNPAKITGVLRGADTMYKLDAGHKVRVTGKLLIDDVKLTLDREEKPVRRIEVTNVEQLDRIDITITKEDIARFKDMTTDPLFWQLLVDSFAPHLHGLEEQKEVCIFALGSCNSPRPFNALLGGPPGKGKTWLLEFAAEIHPLGIKLNIGKASVAGLTSATEKDEDTGTFVTKPGLFILYDGGICCLTELQSIKENKALKVEINDALESKEVSGAKADGPIKIRARCAIVFDTNNFMGGWNYVMPLAHNLKFMEPNLGPFLSRLDLISITPEMDSDEHNANIARSNFRVTNTEEALEKFKADYEIEGQPRYGVDTLRKYFTYVTSLPLPPLSQNTEERFISNFVKVSKEAREYTVDGRYNRIVKTLAQVRARLLLKPEADLDDMEIAIDRANAYKSVQTDGGADANGTLGLETKAKIKNRENQETMYWEAFVKACKDGDGNNKGYCTVHDMEFYLISKGWDTEKIEKYTKRLAEAGKLYEREGQGKFTKIG